MTQDELERVFQFSDKLDALASTEKSRGIVAGCLASFNILYMLRMGATEQEVRDFFERVLQRAVALPSAWKR